MWGVSPSGRWTSVKTWQRAAAAAGSLDPGGIEPATSCPTEPELPGRRGAAGIRTAEVRRLHVAAKLAPPLRSQLRVVTAPLGSVRVGSARASFITFVSSVDREITPPRPREQRLPPGVGAEGGPRSGEPLFWGAHVPACTGPLTEPGKPDRRTPPRLRNTPTAAWMTSARVHLPGQPGFKLR